MPDFFQYQCPTKIVYGVGLSRDFSAELAGLPLKKLVVITDRVLERLKVIDPIIEGVKNAGVEILEIYTDVPPNSEVKTVKKCAEMAARHHADGILAIGGGSVIDTAKAANIVFTHGGDLVGDYSGTQTITSPLKPLIVIPTTAGTGSEVTQAAVILDQQTHTKLSFVDHYLYPTLAILDPEVTVSMPPQITAATGMDALTHAIEACVGIQSNPISDGFAMKAISLVRHHLVTAVKDGGNLEARGGMLTAAVMAGIAFDHSLVGVVHGMAHAAGGLTGLHHGTANSIFLPWGMEYNLETCPEKFAEVANYLGVKKEGRAAIQEVQRLQKELHEACGLPMTLKEAGIDAGLSLKGLEYMLEAIAEGAVNDGTSFYNPREVVKEEVLVQVRKAYG
ncbi:MAG: hypothetical protein A3I75_06430 [Deltaproteobacteria bacterium RIFCSPLOWO2_02_FULL_50_16]|nr:MAG: hypothetical protein A3B79_01470 [Deltaproteobacteria bacterium RIFCSPHIGHO2_02_FULL_50_15]OGQ56073.1 MAG: hypothetical protein A3I75_06430 [Deltaproteobacteria bacterium RIFCSPLOWO2_02_FULL_50_16]OGQ65729.1 MAG: hypothetical protein A3F89_00185 [Deltaproteobacteria bacterium RIFCSPLOWO2_12_FULL_50_11]